MPPVPCLYFRMENEPQQPRLHCYTARSDYPFFETASQHPPLTVSAYPDGHRNDFRSYVLPPPSLRSHLRHTVQYSHPEEKMSLWLHTASRYPEVRRYAPPAHRRTSTQPSSSCLPFHRKLHFHQNNNPCLRSASIPWKYIRIRQNDRSSRRCRQTRSDNRYRR